jgi:RES domain-containing protein
VSDAVLWRIAAITPDYSADDLHGKGAQSGGGRWNRAGTLMVYCSSSIALACLETIVHYRVKTPLPLNRYLVRIDVPEEHYDKRTVFVLKDHPGWEVEPAGLVSIDWGTSWAQGNAALLAEVPSVIVPEETNLLINPRHPDIAQLHATLVRQWLYDSRLR